MTETSFLAEPLFGRTPEEAEQAKQQAAQRRARTAARDWHEVPKGHYALPVYGLTRFVEGDCEGEPAVIGYRLFERKAARHCKNGRVIGRDRFISGAVMLVADADPDEVRREVDDDKRISVHVYGPGGDSKHVWDEIILDTQDGDTFRAKFGQLTGKCGWCGKRLTDPKSKLIGIGPDCRGYR